MENLANKKVEEKAFVVWKRLFKPTNKKSEDLLADFEKVYIGKYESEEDFAYEHFADYICDRYIFDSGFAFSKNIMP